MQFLRNALRRSRIRLGGHSRGFSLIETLVSMTLLLLLSVAVLPVFVQAGMNNASGRESSTLTGYAGTRIETFYPSDFGHAELAVPTDQTETVRREWWLPAHAGGSYAPRPGMSEGTWTTDGSTFTLQNSPFGRTVTVRQYGIADLRDNKMLDNPLPGRTPPAFVQLKEVIVEVDSVHGTSAAGPGRRVTLRYFKAF